MAFGKRVATLSVGTTAVSLAARDESQTEPAPSLFVAASGHDLMTSSAPVERSIALRDDLLRLHGQAAQLAGVIRTRRPLDPLLLEAATEPTSYPLLVEDFRRHFSHRHAGRLLHSVYCLAPASEPDRPMPLLQLKLIELMGVVLSLNRRCLSAHKDDALSIALQSEETADDVDQLIVQSAVAAALLGSLVIEQSKGPMERVPPAADLLKHCDTIVTALARARSHVLEPVTFERRIPKLNWPVVASEFIVEPHAGERMLNDVYVPAGLVPASLAEGPREASTGQAPAEL